jgi:VanZ family protein
MLKKKLLHWLPALVLMGIIFGFSSVPSSKMPDFGLWDTVVHKSGHMLAFGLLALAYWAGLHYEKRRGWLAFLLVILYALSDEFHQSFVPGRHPSLVDALVIDAGGALIALGLVYWRRVRKVQS